MIINYSIIIPHYNTPELLSKCLDSIPKRDDIQIIVVDDKSDEEYIKVLHEMEILYSNVQFIYSDKKGGGGTARNIGVFHSVGEWMLFSDADDFFYTDKLSSLMNKYVKRDNVDVVYLNAKSTIEQSDVESEIQPRIRYILENRKLSEEEKKNRVMFETWEPWTRMCRRKLIIKNDIRFDEIPRQNDMYFGLAVSAYATRVEVEKDFYYCWRQTESSISRKKLDTDSFMNLLQIRYRLDNLYRQRDLDRRTCFLYYIYLSLKFYGSTFTFHNVIPFLKEKSINPFRGLRHYIIHRS